MSDQNNNSQPTTEKPTKPALLARLKSLMNKPFAAPALGLILIAGLVIGWRVQVYLEEQRVIKTDSEPAAQLLRDDAAKPKDPRLFAKVEYNLRSYTKDDTTRAAAKITLRVDDNACREYYGKDGITQCKNNWDFLDPDKSGWSSSPSLEGEWSFKEEDARYTATFDFNQDQLKPGQKYAFSVPGKLGDKVTLSKYDAVFSTAPFELSINSWTFNVDPQDPRKCIISGQVKSPYAFDKESFTQNMRTEALGNMQLGSPELIFAQDGRSVVININVTKLPDTTSPVRLHLQSGIKRTGASDMTSKVTSSGVNVPGVDVFVSLSGVQNFVSTDDDLISRQVLALEFTRPVKVQDVYKSTKAVVLPTYANNDDQKNKRASTWTNYTPSSKVVRDALAGRGLNGLELTPIYTPDEYSTVVSFTYSAAPGYFYLQNPGGSASVTPYSLSGFDRILSVPRMEPELRIMQQGNILSLNGSKKLALFSRALDKVNVNVSRVRPEYVSLLITQTDGVLANPEFNWESRVEMLDLSEQLALSYKPAHTAGNEPDYHALDLTPLLRNNGKGIFLINLEGYMGKSHKNSDTRFLLLTDLGLNIKQASTGERTVFVSSFAGGGPIADVMVEVMGRNGLPVFSGRTNAEGAVKIPSLSGFGREKRPVAIVARKGSDFTYMPIDDHTRMVSTSQFPETQGRMVEAGGISAFVFSERGIFKPGEELRFGALLKSTSWDSAKLKGLPVNAVLTNPRGTKVYEKKHTQDETGLLAITIPTQETDPTGRYNLDIYLDKRHLGSAQVQLEEFQPDNLKVITSFKNVTAAQMRKGWVLPQDLRGLVQVENLYGTAAVDNRVEASVTLNPTRMSFSQYSDYRFFDPGNNAQYYENQLGTATTDEKGEAEFPLGMERYNSGTYRLTLQAQAFETGGGRGVTSSSSVLVSPHKTIVGWKSSAKLNFVAVNSRADVSFIAIDNTLAQTELNGLELVIDEVEYVASLVRDNSGRYRYDKVRKLKPVMKRSVSVGKSGLHIPLPTGTTGEFEVSLLDGGGLTRCNLGYVVAGGSQRRFGLERDATLRVHLDKTEYNGGENMQVFISAPYAGSGLITLESDKVLSHHWFTATTSDSVQNLPVPAGFEGRGFVSVSMVRDIHSDAVHSTPYTYAIAPFIANIEKRDLKVTLDAPALVRPGDTLNMRVTAEKPGKAIVYAVSEGILQLTSYKTPSPLTYFLKQNPLSVSTMQNWDLLMPEFYLMNPSAFGGDYEMAASMASRLNPFRRKSEPSVVYWSGLVDVGPSGATLEWEVPAYFNGALRIMAVAAGASGVGESSRSVTVRGPLVITPDLPVAVAPGDEFEVTAAIANNVDDSGNDLKIDVKVELDEGLEFVRKPLDSINVDEGREGKAVFRLKATQRLGESIVKVTATTAFGGQEIVVKRPVSLSVRPASPRMSSFKAGFVKGKDQVVPVGRSLYPQYAQTEASLSGLPLPMLDGLSGFLTRFPHGCTEQILSAAFPYALLNKSPELLPVPRGLTPAQLRARSEQAIEKGMVTLLERQVVPGRFSLWPYERGGYSFLTPYALDYLLSAKEAGYKVPDDLFRSAQQETLSLLQSTPRSYDALSTVSYAAWVYTRSGQTFTGLPQLVKNLDTNLKNWRQEPAAALLAACYQMMQQSKEAADILKDVKAIDPTGKSHPYSGWFFCRLWDNSLMLSVIARHFPERLNDLESKKALVYVINDIAANAYTTPSAVQAVRGIADYAASNMENKAALELTALDANQKALQEQAVGELVKRLTLGNEASSFRFAGAEGLYWQISTDGFDLKPQPAQAKKLVVKTRYIPAKGQALEDLAQGDEVYVLLTASSTEALDNVAITSLIPGGFEMVISKGGQIVGGGASGSGHAEYDEEDGGEYDEEYEEGEESEEDEYEGEVAWSIDSPAAYPNAAHMRDVQQMLSEAGLNGTPMELVHVERREDRMVAYTSLGTQDRVFIYRIKAINKGKFTLPSVFAEALYDPDARANTTADVIEVK